MSDWQPIETAPRDGTTVLAGAQGRDGHLWHPLPLRFLDGRWRADFAEGGWRSIDPQPTHWMPLPEPPSNNPKGEG